MNCAPKLEKLGNSPHGNKLQAKFEGSVKPDSCCVKGTNDLQPLRGNSGVWLSGEKYMSPQVTLQLFKNNAMVKECSYDVAGNVITFNPPPASVTDFNIDVDPSQNVPRITWKSALDSNSGASFVISRLEPVEVIEDGVPKTIMQAFELGGSTADGRTTEYEVFDYFLSPVAGTHTYINQVVQITGEVETAAETEKTF